MTDEDEANYLRERERSLANWDGLSTHEKDRYWMAEEVWHQWVLHTSTAHDQNPIEKIFNDHHLDMINRAREERRKLSEIMGSLS